MYAFRKRIRRSLAKRLLRLGGYPNGGYLADFFDGVRIEPYPTLYSDAFRVYGPSGHVADTLSLNALAKSGEDIYIVGSGPSINKQNLSLLRDRKVIFLNGAMSLVEKCGLTPYFVSVSDSSFCVKRASMFSLLPKGTNLLLSFAAMKDLYYLNPSAVTENNVYLLLTLDDWVHAYLDAEKGMEAFANLDYGSMNAGTVMADCIRLSAFLGAANTYLLGLDIGNSAEPRFYETAGDAAKSGLLRNYESRILPFMKLAARYFRAKGLGLYNCSPVSRLPYDVIPYSDVMEMKAE